MTKPVAIIVPVINRPEAAIPFVTSLQSQSDLCEVYAIAQEDDRATCKAWAECGAKVVYAPHHGYPVKVNVGYQHTEEPWLLFVGDDVTFHEGALYHALLWGEDFDCSVVSTNDKHSPADRLGIVAPHPLMHRTYITNFGASFEGRGYVASPAYRHQCVDLEWSFIARAREEFIYCPEAVIEHNHPSFLSGAWDSVYELGQSSADEDHNTFINRLMEWGPECTRV